MSDEWKIAHRYEEKDRPTVPAAQLTGFPEPDGTNKGNDTVVDSKNGKYQIHTDIIKVGPRDAMLVQMTDDQGNEFQVQMMGTYTANPRQFVVSSINSTMDKAATEWTLNQVGMKNLAKTLNYDKVKEVSEEQANLQNLSPRVQQEIQNASALFGSAPTQNSNAQAGQNNAVSKPASGRFA